mgnify:CR=1 FL=1
MRVNASRWAADSTSAPRLAGVGVSIATDPRRAGPDLRPAGRPKHDASAPLARRCTYGIVWTASATRTARPTRSPLAVQPMDTWRELWVFRKTREGWSVNVLPPATTAPGIGYAEFAGWVPGGQQDAGSRAKRAARGRHKRSFELVRLDGPRHRATGRRPGLARRIPALAGSGLEARDREPALIASARREAALECQPVTVRRSGAQRADALPRKPAMTSLTTSGSVTGPMWPRSSSTRSTFGSVATSSRATARRRGRARADEIEHRHRQGAKSRQRRGLADQRIAPAANVDDRRGDRALALLRRAPPAARSHPVVDEMLGGPGRVAGVEGVAGGVDGGLDAVGVVRSRRGGVDEREQGRLVENERAHPLRVGQRREQRDRRRRTSGRSASAACRQRPARVRSAPLRRRARWSRSRATRDSCPSRTSPARGRGSAARAAP